MADLTLLRARVYERDKHDAGWGTDDTLTTTYVTQHACYSHQVPYGRVAIAACARYRGADGLAEGAGAGYNLGDGYGNGEGSGGSGFGDGDNDGNGRYPLGVSQATLLGDDGAGNTIGVDGGGAGNAIGDEAEPRYRDPCVKQQRQNKSDALWVHTPVRDTPVSPAPLLRPPAKR